MAPIRASGDPHVDRSYWRPRGLAHHVVCRWVACRTAHKSHSGYRGRSRASCWSSKDCIRLRLVQTRADEIYPLVRIGLGCFTLVWWQWIMVRPSLLTGSWPGSSARRSQRVSGLLARCRQSSSCKRPTASAVTPCYVPWTSFGLRILSSLCLAGARMSAATSPRRWTARNLLSPVSLGGQSPALTGKR